MWLFWQAQQPWKYPINWKKYLRYYFIIWKNIFHMKLNLPFWKTISDRLTIIGNDEFIYVVPFSYFSSLHFKKQILCPPWAEVSSLSTSLYPHWRPCAHERVHTHMLKTVQALVWVAVSVSLMDGPLHPSRHFCEIKIWPVT